MALGTKHVIEQCSQNTMSFFNCLQNKTICTHYFVSRARHTVYLSSHTQRCIGIVLLDSKTQPTTGTSHALTTRLQRCTCLYLSYFWGRHISSTLSQQTYFQRWPINVISAKMSMRVGVVGGVPTPTTLAPGTHRIGLDVRRWVIWLFKSYENDPRQSMLLLDNICWHVQ